MRRHVLVVTGVALVTVVAGIAVAASASAGTTTYEAEATVNTINGGAHIIDCDRCSGGFRVTAIGLLGGLTFTNVVAERDGPTRLALTYYGPEARSAQISINGAVGIAISFPATRAANRPGTMRIVANLGKGDNTLAFNNPVGVAPDLDKLVVTTDGTPPPPAPTATAPEAPGTPATAGQAPSSPPAYSSPPAESVPPQALPPSPGGAAGNAAFESEVITLVNQERATVGCNPLVVDARLTAAARGQSADMAARNYFSHTTPEGQDFASRLTKAGYRWSGAGENIAKGQRTPADVMRSWMNSEGHKANILNCGFKNIGVGVAADVTGSILWTQDFASRS